MACKSVTEIKDHAKNFPNAPRIYLKLKHLFNSVVDCFQSSLCFQDMSLSHNPKVSASKDPRQPIILNKTILYTLVLLFYCLFFFVCFFFFCLRCFFVVVFFFFFGGGGGGVNKVFDRIVL